MTDDRFGEELASEDDDEDVRYGLTALGRTVLDERPGFTGFGPCAASRPACECGSQPAAARRDAVRVRRRRSTPRVG